MTLVMAWVLLASAAVAAGVLVAETVLRVRGRATRGLWGLGLCAIGTVTAFALFAPVATDTSPSSAPPIVETPLALTAVTAGTTSWLDRASAWMRVAVGVGDGILPAAWALTSSLLFTLLVLSHVRLSGERRRARPTRLQGHRVLLTERLGPAVAGFRRPVVLVPQWVLALDHASQRLLLAHEAEHVRAHDSRLLTAGAVVAALVPWNPVAWWMVRRLRLAVEQDCDRRVLAANPGVRRYADLLLVAAGTSRFPARILAAHFGEHSTDLERRIHAMTDARLRWRTLTLTAAGAALLAAAACETPRPDPVAPGAAREKKEADQASAPSGVYFEFQVETPVSAAPGSASPRYPAILREAGVEGEVLASFIVGEDGLADPSTLKVIRSTHELFTTAVREALPAMRFTPAVLRGSKVKQLVQQPFSFRIAGAGSGVTREIGAEPRGGAAGEFVEFPSLVRSSSPPGSSQNVLVYSSTGEVVARHSVEGRLTEVRIDDIAAVEVFRRRSCAAGDPECPTTMHIRLKPGREQAYRRK